MERKKSAKVKAKRNKERNITDKLKLQQKNRKISKLNAEFEKKQSQDLQVGFQLYYFWSNPTWTQPEIRTEKQKISELKAEFEELSAESEKLKAESEKQNAESEKLNAEFEKLKNSKQNVEIPESRM